MNIHELKVTIMGTTDNIVELLGKTKVIAKHINPIEAVIIFAFVVIEFIPIK